MVDIEGMAEHTGHIHAVYDVNCGAVRWEIELDTHIGFAMPAIEYTPRVGDAVTLWANKLGIVRYLTFNGGPRVPVWPENPPAFFGVRRRGGES